jgi:hypothetical protein
MDREAIMRELDRILETHGIAMDRDAIKEDIFKVVDDVYNEGWFDGYYEG